MASRQKWMLVLVLVLGLLAAVMYLTRDSYGIVGSRTYDFATALFSACNRRDAETVVKLSAMLESAEARGEVAQQEAEWLRGIVAEANAGDWKSAASASRELLEAQVEEP